MPGCNGAGTAEKSYPSPRSGAAAERTYSTSEVRGAAGRSYPMPEASGGSREEQSHLQGAVASWAQEGLEKLSHAEDQEGWR